MSKFVNPLLEWHQGLIKPIQNIYEKKPIFLNNLSSRLCEMVKEELEIDLIHRPEDYQSHHYSPVSFARTELASGLLTEEICDEIIAFSHGNIWECGAGSGYNGFLLEQKGAQVYCTDCVNNWFSPRFCRVSQRPSYRRIREISMKDGALLYIWPIDEFHDLERWLEAGGNKLIIIGDFSPCHITISEYEQKGIAYDLKDIPPICPIFNLEGWKKVKEMEPPHYDESIKDMVQFWIKTK